jgi:plastocyanin
MRSRYTTVLGIAAVVMALGLGACGGDEPAPAGGGGDAGTAAPGAPADAGGDQSVTVTTQNFAFSPSELSVASGGTVTVDNKDDAPHTFTVTDSDVNVEVDPGDTADATIDLDAGSYDFVCKLHPDMTGTLTVT